MKKCSNTKCKASPTTHGNEDNFCWLCGSPLKEYTEPECSCGRLLDKSDHFCPLCGKKTEVE